MFDSISVLIEKTGSQLSREGHPVLSAAVGGGIGSAAGAVAGNYAGKADVEGFNSFKYVKNYVDRMPGRERMDDLDVKIERAKLQNIPTDKNLSKAHITSKVKKLAIPGLVGGAVLGLGANYLANKRQADEISSLIEKIGQILSD